MRASPSALPRRTRRARVARILPLLLVGLAACVDVDGKLAADGSLTMRYTYDPPRHATYASERVRLASPHVRVEDLEANQTIEGYPPREFATATLAVDDATKLDTAPAFAGVRIATDLEAGRLTITVPGLDAEARARAAASPEGVDRRALRLSLVLPGPVTAADPGATLDGRRVTWTLSIREFAAAGDTVTLRASWTPDGGDAAAPAHSM